MIETYEPYVAVLLVVIVVTGMACTILLLNHLLHLLVVVEIDL